MIKCGRQFHKGGKMPDTVSEGWIGVDLDGTLAEYHGWVSPEHIGPPVPKMLARVKRWIKEGRCVKIFTARCSIPEQVPPVKKWLRKNGLDGLEITNIKDYGMLELWDDRCVQVIPNTGEPVGQSHIERGDKNE